MAMITSTPILFYVTRNSAGAMIDCGFTDGQGLHAITLIAHAAGCVVQAVPRNITRH